MIFTFTDKSGKKRPATPAEQAYVLRVLKLHRLYWKWFTIRAVAFVTLVVLLAQEYEAYTK